MRSPEAMKRLALSYDSLLADVYWIRAVQHYGDTKRSDDRRQELRAALPAARPDDVARSALQHRLPVRRHLPRRAAARRARPARPGHRAAREGARGAARQLASSTQAHRLRPLLVAPGLRDRGRVVRRGVASCPGAPVWMAPLAAVTLAQGGNRQGVAAAVAADRADARPTTGSATRPLRRLQQLDAMDQIDALRTALAALHGTARAGAPASWDGPGARPGSCAASPLDPTGAAVPARRTATVSLDPDVAAAAAARSRQPRCDDDAAVIVVFALRSASSSAASSTSASTGCRAASRSSGRRRAARSCERALAWFENVPVAELAGAAAGAAARAGAPISAMYPARRARSTGAALRRGVSTGTARRRSGSSGLLFGCAMIVLFVIDLQHRILPNVITLPGIVIGLVAQPLPAAGLAVVAHRRARRRRRALRDRRGLLPRARRRRARAWAT